MFSDLLHPSAKLITNLTYIFPTMIYLLLCRAIPKQSLDCKALNHALPEAPNGSSSGAELPTDLERVRETLRREEEALNRLKEEVEGLRTSQKV